jgi:hypothetical protein
MALHDGKNAALLFFLLLWSLQLSHAQRFLRDVGQAKAQARMESELEGVDLGGMSREMFLLKKENWEL